MEREYTVLTSPTASQISGYGPLGLGPRWIAYSGIPVPVLGTGRVSPQLLRACLVGALENLPARQVDPTASDQNRTLGDAARPGQLFQGPIQTCPK